MLIIINQSIINDHRLSIINRIIINDDMLASVSVFIYLQFFPFKEEGSQEAEEDSLPIERKE